MIAPSFESIHEFGHEEIKFLIAKPVWRNSLGTRNKPHYTLIRHTRYKTNLVLLCYCECHVYYLILLRIVNKIVSCYLQAISFTIWVNYTTQE